MTKAFVAINDPVHNLLRNLTRRIPLMPRVTQDGSLRLEYRTEGVDFPPPYWGLAFDHAVKGIPVLHAMARISRPSPPVIADLMRREGCLDVLKLDRRCVRDVRLKLHGGAPGLVSTEVLIYGTGMLRANNDNSSEALHRMLWAQYGRLAPAGEKVSATIRCLSRKTGSSGFSGKESFESTNVLYGDTLGELQQIWDRRADTEFLEQIVCLLQSVTLENSMPQAFHAPMNLETAVAYHLKAGAIWRKPPASARSLLRRLESILDNTIVDNTPRVIFRTPPATHDSADRPNGNGPGWNGDSLGYDGWLSGSDPS